MKTDGITKQDLSIKEIALELWKGNCRLFIGSGLSLELPNAPSHLTLAHACIERSVWLKQLNLIRSDGNRLKLLEEITPAQVLEYYSYRHGRNTLEGLVLSSLRALRPEGLAYTALGQLSNKKNEAGANLVEWLYTTNYDDTLRKEIGEAKSAIVTDSETFRALANERELVKIVHLHGHIDSNIKILTEFDVFRSIAEIDELLFRQLRTDLETKKIVFLGYGFRDEDIKFMLLIANIRTRRSGELLGWGVFPKNSSSRAQPGDVEGKWAFFQYLWEKRGIKFLDYKASEFLPKLVSEIDALDLEKEIDDIVRLHALSREKVLALTGKVKSNLPLLTPRAAIQTLKRIL